MSNFAISSHKSSIKLSKLIFSWIICFVLALALTFTFLPVSSLVAEAKDVSVINSGGAVTYIKGDFSAFKVDSFEDAYKFLNHIKESFGFEDSKEALKEIKVVNDIDSKVYKFTQLHNGMPVKGGQINLSVGKDKVPISISGTYYKNIVFDDVINITEDKAQKLAIEKYGVSQITFDKLIYDISGETAYINYLFLAEGETSFKVYVNAKTFEIYSIYSNDGFLSTSAPPENVSFETESIIEENYFGEHVSLSVGKYLQKGKYVYILADKEKNIYITSGLNIKDNEYTSSKPYYYEYYYSNNGVFDDPVAVQAYEYLLKCYDFYNDEENFGVAVTGLKNVLDQDVKLIGIVHYGQNYENAGYHLPQGDSTTGYFLFGDGNPYYGLSGTKSFVAGLDVVGHEYTHAVATSIVDLEYLNESGAISEAIADMFGAVIEGHDISDEEFWTMGEDLSFDGSSFRDIAAPSLTNNASSVSTLYPYCNKLNCDHSYCDYGNVHANSTLLTHATYLMYKLDPDFFTTYNILSLWYKTLNKLSPSATFTEFASDMVFSAEELRWSEEKINEIKNAFSMIGLPGYYGEKIWGDNYLTYPQGEGTVSSPYIITGERDLASVMYLVNTGAEDGRYLNARYTLTTNINLRDIAWEPIGTEEYPFNGTFNGGGYTINGLNLNNEQASYNGLFGVTGSSSYIYNLNIGAGNTQSKALYTGAIVGKHLGVLDSCTSALNITGKNVGGLAGFIENNYCGQVISNSFVTAGLTGEIVGGLVSRFSSIKDESTLDMNYGYISACYTTGTIVGNTIGAFVGESNGLILINNLSIAKLIGESDQGYVGGMVGKIQFRPLNSSLSVRNSKNYFINNFTAVTIEGKGDKGLAFAGVSGNNDEGEILVQKCTLKKQGEIEKYSESAIVIEKDVKLSESEQFSGDFAFDKQSFYYLDNFSSLEGCSTFDLLYTYRLGGDKQMPVLISSSFWLSFSANSFDGGNGSKANPYKIRTAEQLALLAELLADDKLYSKYAVASYVLTSDIDLYGKLWAGIGYSKLLIVENNGEKTTVGGTLYPFMGSFDACGHTISNLTGVSAMSVQSVKKNAYYLMSYSGSLFGLTASDLSEQGETTEIKNLTIENPYINGSFAGAVVSEALDDIVLSKVGVSGGKIISSSVAGGLIGSLGGISISPEREVKSEILGCEVNSSLTGRVVGGCIGQAYDTNTETSVNISKFLFRGGISVNGKDTDIENGKSYKATAGSIVGETLVNSLNIVSCISCGNIVSYERNCLLGGFVGAVSQNNSKNSVASVSISVRSSKFSGAAYCILDSLSTRAGKIVGGVYSLSPLSVSVSADNTTFVSIDGKTIFDNNKMLISVDDQSVVSSSPLFSGDFDYYSEEYFNNTKYFAEDDAWSVEEVDRFFIVVVVKDYDGKVLYNSGKLKSGEIIPPIEDPTRAADPQYYYDFIGWSEDLSNINHSMTVYARYKSTLRSYQVTYKDEDGNVVYTIDQYYGSGIDQRVKAPEKKGNFFIRYSFIRWGEEGQFVDGNLVVTPYYKSHLTSAFTALLWTIGAVVVLVGVSIWSRRRKSFR